MVSRHTVTLANSIVGVSVLAMPFCFKQCGIVLATLSLMVGAIMTRMMCYFLLKAAVMSRRRTYEMLAWSTFGHTGKFMVEISIIGFLIGTLIAFMVVIGDLGPEILSEIFSMENNSSLRTITMTALSLFVALPLGLLRNIDSLSSVSTASVLFYLFLVLKILSEGIGPLWSGEYLERIDFWKSGGVLQCIPIFSMALSCQTQIFGIYDALPEPSLQKMNEIVKQAVNICTFFYFCVGFFGYIAFSHHNFGGNILLSFAPAWSTQLIKSMFLMSVVFSVPLVVFPCRASLHSMIFKSGSTYHQVHDMTTNYIPESRLKFLTVTIVGSTLIVGILIPNIELVLGLVGSTTGSVICIIFPSIMFVRVTSKHTTERLLAQGMFFIGVVLMLLTTYATLYAAEQSQVNEKIPDPLRVTDNLLYMKAGLRQDDVQLNSPLSKLDEGQIERRDRIEFHRKPVERVNKDQPVKAEISSSTQKAKENKLSQNPSKKKTNFEDNQLPSKAPSSLKEISINSSYNREYVAKKENKITNVSPHSVQAAMSKDDKPVLNNDVPSKDTIALAKSDDKKEFVDKQVAEAFLKKLEEHQESQKKLLEEQKEILEELKQHHAQDVREKIEKEKLVDKDGNKAAESLNKNTLSAGEKKSFSKTKVQSDAVAPPVNSVLTADKITREQEKIIEKLSENIEKESKNVQLLEKFEEGLNKEVKMMDVQKLEKNENAAPAPIENKLSQLAQKEETLSNDRQIRGSLQTAENQDTNNVVVNVPLAKEGSLTNLNKADPELVNSNSKVGNSHPIPMHENEKQGSVSNVEDEFVISDKNNKPNSIGNANQKNSAIKYNEQKIVEVSSKMVVPEKSELARDKKLNDKAASEKQVISENSPKEKIDREI